MQRITIAAVKMANKETGFMLRSYERNSENKLAWACSVVHDTQFNLMGLVWLSYPFLFCYTKQSPFCFFLLPSF